MITIKMQGRLGNQLFQYAFARNLKEKYYPQDEIYINFEHVYSEGKKEDGFDDSLKYFNIQDYKTTDKLNINIFQKLIFVLYLCIRKVLRAITKCGNDSKRIEVPFFKVLNRFGIYCLSNGYCDFKKSIFKNKLLLGYFESDKYFKEISSIIKKEYTPKLPVCKDNLNLFNIINNTNSICITIRRGDFLDAANMKAHYICTNEYFYKAVNIIREKVENPVFIVFSDDVEWVKQNMQFDGEVYYETGNDPIWEKLRLMSSCKHFVISNSTFSWWAQYLSTNDNKVVIAPSRWNNKIKNKDIYQDNWTQIDV